MTSQLKLGEVLVEALKEKLKANMASRILAINADPALPHINPELATPRPTGGPSLDGSDYYTSGIESVPFTPAIIVAEGAAEFGEEGAHSFITGTRIMVWILEADASREQLGKRLQRQARAVIESVWDDEPREQLNQPSGARAAFRVFPLRTMPGRVFEPDQDDSWRGFYGVEFVCQQFEGV